MPFAFFLAQTAAEIGLPMPTNTKKAWMACHFSPYNAGLSNLPSVLESGSMVILNDLMPVADHDPERIAQQLLDVVQKHQCSRVLLDLQRPGHSRTATIAKAITEALPCPVGVSECYANGSAYPVFLPPLPLHMALDAYLAPWEGRPVWLEVMPEQAQYIITKEGCRRDSSTGAGQLPFFDEITCCHYGAEVTDDAIRFTLSRGQAELERLWQMGNIDCFVGLYQEFAQPEAQATAFAQ